MKVRTDFVTNSSSSSFIVALKKPVDVENLVKINKENIENFVSDYLNDKDYQVYSDINDTSIETASKSLEQKLRDLVTKEFLFDLDSHIVLSLYCSNESDVAFDGLLYEFGLQLPPGSLSEEV